jgi:hypothetical protein
MIDIGSIGFILRALLILNITRIARKIQTAYKKAKINIQEKHLYTVRKYLNIGRFSLLIMGIFLHVFEDSMINYLFFISRGILSGYLSTTLQKKNLE